MTLLDGLLIAAATGFVAALGTWFAGRLLQDRDEQHRGLAAGRLVYLELQRNYASAVAARNENRSSQSLPLMTSKVWDALQVDVTKILDKRQIGVVVSPYFWLDILRVQGQSDWLTRGYAKLSGDERKWFDQLHTALREAKDVLAPLVWDHDQLKRLMEADRDAGML